jgi:uncharacterized protein VirK/YbjX
MDRHGFSKTDFEDKDVSERLRALTMVKCGHHIQTSMLQLSLKQKRIANDWLNTYIYQKLQCDHWLQVLIADFQIICNEELFDPELSSKKDYTNLFVRDTNTFPVLLEKDTDISTTEYK